MAAKKVCDVDNCSRFNVTQWVIGIAVLLMLASQGYLIKRIDNIEITLSKKIGSVQDGLFEHLQASNRLDLRVSLLEREVEEWE